MRQRFDQYVNLRPAQLLPGVASPLRRTKARRHRHARLPREHRGRVRRHRRPPVRGHAGTRSPSRPTSSRAAASSGSLRSAFELAPDAARKLASDHQVERAASRMRHVGRGRRRGRAPTTPTSRPTAARRRRGDGLRAQPERSTWWSASNLFGDILTDIGAAIRAAWGWRPAPTSTRTRGVPGDVRAGARLGARHRRPGHRQPDRRDLGGRDDARRTWATTRRPRSVTAAIESVLAREGLRRPTSAARRRRPRSATR